MGTSVKESLLQSARLRTKSIDIDGVLVTIREVGALEFAEYGNLLKTDRIRATSSLVAACVVDDEGNTVLSLEEAAVLVKSARVSMPLVSAIMSLSGFGDDDQKEPVAD